MAINGQCQESCGDRNILYLVFINQYSGCDIILQFCKMLPSLETDLRALWDVSVLFLEMAPESQLHQIKKLNFLNLNQAIQKTWAQSPS